MVVFEDEEEEDKEEPLVNVGKGEERRPFKLLLCCVEDVEDEELLGLMGNGLWKPLAVDDEEEEVTVAGALEGDPEIHACLVCLVIS